MAPENKVEGIGNEGSWGKISVNKCEKPKGHFDLYNHI